MKEEFVTIRLWCLSTVSYRGSSDMTVSDLQFKCTCSRKCHVRKHCTKEIWFIEIFIWLIDIASCPKYTHFCKIGNKGGVDKTDPNKLRKR